MDSLVTIEYRDVNTKDLVYSKDVNENVTITFYQKLEEILMIVKGSVLISYIDIDTSESILPSEKIEDMDMGEYSYQGKEVEGYELLTENNQKVILNIENREISIDFKYKKKEITEYTIDLNYYGIKNDGTSPVETSKGINAALKDIAAFSKYKKVIFPKGIYLIDENNPITISLKNITIDLNGSIFRINVNGLLSYSIIDFKDGAENLIFTNGVIEGDRDTHDYTTVSGTHEWGCGIMINGGSNCIIEKIKVTSVTGYGVCTKSGNNSHRYNTVAIKDIELGDINSKGAAIESAETSRTKAYDITACEGAFEFGYTLGYQGYPYVKVSKYVSYFYDKNNVFISLKECIQYRKVTIPEGAMYVRFVFSQINIISNLGYVGWISNFRPPTNMILKNCIIVNNRSLGLAFCGGQKWTIEDNTFENNGGQAPGYAIDIEDGWELSQDIIVKNNKFIGSKVGDIVTCAGDNIEFEGNEFTSIVYMWGRTTNYKFVNNIFKNNIVNYEYSTKVEGTGNKFFNSKFRMQQRNSEVTERPYIHGETFINSSIDRMNELDIVTDSLITSDGTVSVRLVGKLENCTLKMNQCYLSAELSSCIIEDSILSVLLNASMNRCNVIKSVVRTHGNTGTISINNCNIIDCNILTQTFGSATIIYIQNNVIEMSSSAPILMNLSAGKMKELKFNNNVVTNNSNNSVFYLFDTTYSTPNGMVTLKENIFNENLSQYIFSGTTIKQGIFRFYSIDNIINGSAIMLSPIYLNNVYFFINN